MGVASDKAAYRIRPGNADDLGFLWDMLYEAVHWGPEKQGPKPPREEILSWPGIRHYLEGWGRSGDFALIATNLADNRRIGAAWHRLMSPEDPGYGFVNASTPELGLAVAPDFRGRGVGGALLHALMDAARSRSFGALSLSVEYSNPAARLYERHGFRRLFVVGDSWTMKADLSATVGDE